MRACAEESTSDLMAQRLQKVDQLETGGMTPYAYRYSATHKSAELSEVFDALPPGEEDEAPEDEGEVDFVRRLRKRHAKTQRRVLEMYRRATSLVYGVSQITLHSNATKVEVALEGLDLFAELP